MSYLVYCIKDKPLAKGAPWQAHDARWFKVKWRGVAGRVLVNPLRREIRYNRFTRFGQMLRANHESEQHYITLAIRATPMEEDGIDWNKAYLWEEYREWSSGQISEDTRKG